MLLYGGSENLGSRWFKSQLQSTSHSYIAKIKKSQLQSSRSYNYLFIYFTQSINEEFYCSQPIGVSTGTRVPDYPLPYDYPGTVEMRMEARLTLHGRE